LNRKKPKPIKIFTDGTSAESEDYAPSAIRVMNENSSDTHYYHKKKVNQ